MLSIARALATIVLIASFLPQAALADCRGSHAVDHCLIGTWKMTESGAERWMRENIHSAHVQSVQATNNTIAFTADGKFKTGKINVNAQVVGEDRSAAASGHLETQASGTWAAGAGRLDMCPAQMTQSGSVHLQDGEGNAITTPMARIPQQSSEISYTCTGSTFTTTQPMPRGTTATSTYARLH